MEVLTDQQIQERFAQLPPDMQQAIESSHVEEHLQTVGTRFGLHIDQLGALKDATYLVMLGFADPSEFAADIADFAHLSKDAAAQVAQSIDAELFTPIRQSMQVFAAGQGSGAPKPESYAPAVSTPPIAKASSTQVPVPPPPAPKAPPVVPAAPPATNSGAIMSAAITKMPPAPTSATTPASAVAATPSATTPTITTMPSAAAAAIAPVAAKVVFPSASTPSAKERVAALNQTPTVKTIPAPAPAAKGYTVDPYREPIE